MTLTFTLFDIIMQWHTARQISLFRFSAVEYEWGSQMRAAKRIEAMTKPTMEENIW